MTPMHLTAMNAHLDAARAAERAEAAAILDSAHRSVKTEIQYKTMTNQANDLAIEARSHSRTIYNRTLGTAANHGFDEGLINAERACRASLHRSFHEQARYHILAANFYSGENNAVRNPIRR